MRMKNRLKWPLHSEMAFPWTLIASCKFHNFSPTHSPSLAKVPFGKSLGWLLQGSCGNTGQQR
jgi:hypothetical protein